MNEAGLIERWLLVGEDDTLAEALQMVARDLALARLESFRSVSDALHAVRRSEERIDLVIMACEDAPTKALFAAGAIHRLAPTAQIVLISNGADEFTAKELRVAGIVGVLAKPFSLLLLRRMMMALNSRANELQTPAVEDARASTGIGAPVKFTVRRGVYCFSSFQRWLS